MNVFTPNLPATSRPSHTPAFGQAGSTLSPVMAVIFTGLVLMILVFSVIAENVGNSPYLSWAYAGASVLIGLTLLGIYRLLRFLEKRRVATGRRDPLLLRRLMEAEIEAAAGPLRKRLDNPDLTVATVFEQVLQDQVEALFTTDALRFTELRRKLDHSGIEKQTGSGFRRFFLSETAYPDTPLPEALLLMERAVAKSHDEGLAEGLVHLKNAHHKLHTLMGDYLDLLPCTPEEIAKLRKKFPFRPPDDKLAKEMIFARKFLNHLVRRHSGEVNPSAVHREAARLDDAASIRVPGLSAAVAAYEKAWRELIDAYDQRY